MVGLTLFSFFSDRWWLEAVYYNISVHRTTALLFGPFNYRRVLSLRNSDFSFSARFHYLYSHIRASWPKLCSTFFFRRYQGGVFGVPHAQFLFGQSDSQHHQQQLMGRAEPLAVSSASSSVDHPTAAVMNRSQFGSGGLNLNLGVLPSKVPRLSESDSDKVNADYSKF